MIEWLINLMAKRPKTTFVDSLPPLSNPPLDIPAPLAVKPPAITVRAAVAMLPEGKWRILGYSGEEDASITTILLTDLPHNTRIQWITAEIPIPAEHITAKVEDQI